MNSKRIKITIEVDGHIVTMESNNIVIHDLMKFHQTDRVSIMDKLYTSLKNLLLNEVFKNNDYMPFRGVTGANSDQNDITNKINSDN